MSKSRTSRDHLGFLTALLSDCSEYYPTLHRGFARDLSRIESHYREVGPRVFLLDLPALDKVLTSALERGSLARTGIALSRSINTRTNVPRLFQGLWLLIFSLDGCLKPDADPTAIQLLRQLFAGQKKYRVECAPEVLYETVQEYYRTDDRLPPPSPLWDSDGVDCTYAALGSIDDRIENDASAQLSLFPRGDVGGIRPLLGTVQQVADCIATGLGEYIPSLSAFRHGPGATSEYPRGTGYKYLFPTWGSRLDALFPYEEFAIADTTVLEGYAPVGDAAIKLTEPSSRLVAVPKTQKAPRLIAAEPTSHQWCQQAVASFLNERIAATHLGKSIDFRQQSLSQDAARRGSLTGDTATVDLSSASDRISTWLIERMFRRNHSLLRAFVSTRTRFITQDLDKKSPSLYRLRKFSSMGSALTFPVQSILFFMLVIGIGCHLTGTKPKDYWRLCKQVRVYGDDLIFPVAWVPQVIEVFTSLYLKVNVDKTFYHGSFREACGVDVWKGHDVTPSYFLQFPEEAKLGSIASIVQTSNNFFLKGFWRTAQWMRGLVPRRFASAIPVVPIGSGILGYQSFSGYEPTLKQRWNRDLQRMDVQVFAITAKKGTSRHEGSANLLQFFTEDPTQSDLSDWCSGMFGRSDQTVKRIWVDEFLLTQTASCLLT